MTFHVFLYLSVLPHSYTDIALCGLFLLSFTDLYSNIPTLTSPCVIFFDDFLWLAVLPLPYTDITLCFSCFPAPTLACVAFLWLSCTFYDFLYLPVLTHPYTNIALWFFFLFPCTYLYFHNRTPKLPCVAFLCVIVLICTRTL